MSRKKNLLDYLALTLFIMCMGLALSASLEYVTRATEREYLGQGIWVLSMASLWRCGPSASTTWHRTRSTSS